MSASKAIRNSSEDALHSDRADQGMAACPARRGASHAPKRAALQGEALHEVDQWPAAFFAPAAQVLRIRHVRRAHVSKPMAGVDFGKLPTIIEQLTEC